MDRERKPTKIDPLFEFVGERLFVQENPRVLELFVEPVLYPPDAADCVVQVAVPGQHDHGSVGFPNIQGLACVEIWWDVVLVGDVFVRGGGELVFDVRDGSHAAVFLVGDGKDEVEADLSEESARRHDQRLGGFGSRPTLTRMITTRTAYRPRGDMACMTGEGKELERGRIGVPA